MAKTAKNAKRANGDLVNIYAPAGKAEAVRLLMANGGKSATPATRVAAFMRKAPTWTLQPSGRLRSPIRRKFASTLGVLPGLVYAVESCHLGQVDDDPSVERHRDALMEAGLLE